MLAEGRACAGGQREYGCQGVCAEESSVRLVARKPWKLEGLGQPEWQNKGCVKAEVKEAGIRVQMEQADKCEGCRA